jgi:hypothetical protein
VDVRISTNAQQYVATNANLTFTYYVAHELVGIEPQSGFLTGWTLVQLHGVGLLQARTPDGMGLHCARQGASNGLPLSCGVRWRVRLLPPCDYHAHR